MLYEKNKFNLRTFNLQTRFKEHIMFASWGWPVYSYRQHNTFIHSHVTATIWKIEKGTGG
jgi:hypothetical protein